ncbi:MAG: hypothetical protein GY853_06710 [PVC group bacterium]|nr:hypothetical protein [PVC group bacterium]
MKDTEYFNRPNIPMKEIKLYSGETVKMDDDGNMLCVLCRCAGNKSCGHEPKDEEQQCSLDGAGRCFCCTDKEEKRINET